MAFDHMCEILLSQDRGQAVFGETFRYHSA